MCVLSYAVVAILVAVVCGTDALYIYFTKGEVFSYYQITALYLLILAGIVHYCRQELKETSEEESKEEKDDVWEKRD
ncbi:MAG: hypothetical protein A3J62_01010 [Candidatus Buchananbacteria bacterium RIFCSPHIGHO2_02_FULL_38_8]|uniref:Uncharacterized protein n=1 Tax=Candidatus Buchananbacteria bacterium RIFCSPHIGHO2_02_FULL_38_8 TaxID=1797538 RepID=A0A1G1Y6G0_9BACT|nr:MAG: hypothetical protein A3J62_01010 [Candidatus Buchananbacteria bacterium RIFCSPHIGHO2_02_FULL_38_8]